MNKAKFVRMKAIFRVRGNSSAVRLVSERDSFCPLFMVTLNTSTNRMVRPDNSKVQNNFMNCHDNDDHSNSPLLSS